jgi:hypothetical protein
MSQTERSKRLRLMVKKLNRERKRQAIRVDILCNDLVAAQREFLRRLDGIDFAAHFYKCLLGAMDLRTLLARAGRLIKEELPETAVLFFLRQEQGCNMHAADEDLIAADKYLRLEECIAPEIAETICKWNRRCTIDDLYTMGLEGPRADLNRLSLVTLPLSELGRSLGFLLLCRPATRPLAGEDLDRLTLILCGLSQAIRGCASLHCRQ